MKMKHNSSIIDFKISACTITKNEEENIAKSINSYKKYVDEIIVVDTGSTDNTVEIAKSLGAKIIHFEWVNDFSAAKNAALDAATGDWIIFLDADESFVGDCAKNIKTMIAEAVSKTANIISCIMENTNKKSGEVQDSITCFRLFKSVFRYQYPIHEDLYGENKKIVYNVPESRLKILHTGYSADILESKAKRNLEPMLIQMKQEKNEYRKASLCIMLADAYRALNDYEKVYEYSKKYFEEYSQLKIPIYSNASRPYMQIIMSSMVLNKHEETEKYIKKYVDEYPNSSIALRFQGLNYYKKGEFSNAVTSFLKVLDNLDNTTHNEITYNFKKAELYEIIAICDESLFDMEEALHFHFLGAKEPVEYELSITNLFRLLKYTPDEYVEKVLCEILDSADSKKKKSMLYWVMHSFEGRNINFLYDLFKKDTENNYLEHEKIVSAFL